jgi:RNA exonuclease 4
LDLADALASLRAHIPPNAILVGQNILKDVQWLQLAEGVDYFQLIDISALFRVWNASRGEYTTFSQGKSARARLFVHLTCAVASINVCLLFVDHCAKVWLGTPDREGHNALEDAAISMALFNTYRNVQWDPVRLQQLQFATFTATRIPGFSTRFPVVDNCWYALCLCNLTIALHYYSLITLIYVCIQHGK